MSGQAQERHTASFEGRGDAPVPPLEGRFPNPHPSKLDDSSVDSGGHLNFTAAKRYLDSRRLPPEMLSVCLKILDALSELEPVEWHEIDLSFFEGRLASQEIERLIPALVFLCTMSGPAVPLSLHAYLDTDDGRVYLSKRELFDLVRNGKLYHPHTGVPVPSPLSRTCLFCSISDGIKT